MILWRHRHCCTKESGGAIWRCRLTREIPGCDVDAALALHPGPLCQLRRDPPAQVCAPRHVLPLQVPEDGRGAAPGTACGADDAAVPTFIFKIEAVLGMSFCDPSSSLQRSGAISWLLPTRPFATSRAASSEWTGMTMASYTDTWVEHELRQVAAEQRTAEASSGGAATNAAVAEFEEGLEQAA